MNKTIELDLTTQDQESYITQYIENNMSSATLEHYLHILNTTKSIDEACKSAILNEIVILALISKLKN